MILEAANEGADAYRISARGTRNFDPELLKKSGFDDTEIDKVAQGMRDYVSWLRDSNGGELPPPPIKLSKEERDARREVREGFLSDEQYRAALFATGQKNAAVFAKLKEGSQAWDAGIRSGDKLLSINGVSIFDLADFADGRDQMAAGGMHILVVVQAGEQTTIAVACCRPRWGPVDMTTQVPSSVGSAD
jgi:membrane-associated protease RseP (regulator of RpoE activity)